MLAGYLASIGYIILLVVGTFCFGYAAKRSSPLYVLWLETLLGTALILPLLLLEQITLPQLFAKPALQNWAWLSASAVFGFTGGNFFALINLRTAGEQTNSLLSPAITAVTVFFGFFIFKEKLLPLQWLGVVLVLVAVVYFLRATVKISADATRSKTGAISGAATVLLISLSIVCSIKGAAENISILHALFIRLLVALLLVSCIYFMQKKKAPEAGSKVFFGAVILGVVVQTVVSNYLWYYASFSIGIAVFQTLIATFPLWVYAIDVYVLKKSKPSAFFLAVSFIAAIGICLVML